MIPQEAKDLLLLYKANLAYSRIADLCKIYGKEEVFKVLGFL